jgi:hypothetical protein
MNNKTTIKIFNPSKDKNVSFLSLINIAKLTIDMIIENIEYDECLTEEERTLKLISLEGLKSDIDSGSVDPNSEKVWASVANYEFITQNI